MSSSLPCSERPYSLPELEEKLDELLAPVLSSRRTAAAIAAELAQVERSRQDFVLHWTSVTARSNAELAFQFAAHALRAFRLMDQAGVEQWLIHAMDIYDRQGLYPGAAALKDVSSFARRLKDEAQGVAFEDVAEVLELFLRGLSGRRLKLEAGDETYTDTTTAFLPHRIALFPSREQNFRAYKVIAAHLWAQTRFGTFHTDWAQRLSAYPDREAALARLACLETVRLDACLARWLPGLARDVGALRGSAALPPEAAALVPRLARPEATVEDSLTALALLAPGVELPAWCYVGRLFPERVEAARAQRIAKEKELFRSLLSQLAAEIRSSGTPAQDPAVFSLRPLPLLAPSDLPRYQLLLDGQPVEPPPEAAGLMESIIQDLGDIPPDYLVPAGAGGYRPDSTPANPAADVWKGAYHEEGAYFYDEWDYRRRHYRKDWCVLRELDVHPGDLGFVEHTLRKYAPRVAQLKRTFEILRSEDATLKKQPHGDEVDLDALVDAYVDARQGRELSERLFVKRRKAERNMAVMLMVDCSGSTKGWINDAEREALVMLCEALEALGDRYAIYGFSGMTRKRCEVYRVKRFDEPYGERVKRRIAGILPLDYTRMGVAIRHLTRLLNEVEARTKLLVTLSDGKPDDYSDGYRGEYGIEDTRQALLEAKRSGIHPFCITIDKEARDYLPRMYGEVNYTLVDDVARLPLKVADIYRKLTT